jgi:DHA1 family multidrug resistance protein-like MFS transporter
MPAPAFVDAAADAPRARSVVHDPSFLAALAIAVVVALGFGLVIPVLPLFARSFDVGLFAVSAVVSAFAGARLVSNVYAGTLADRIGTGQAVGIGALVVAASSLATATAPSFWALLVYRGLGGFGSALFFTALLTHVVRIVPGDQRGRAMGMLQGAFLVGISFGPTIGGVLAEPLGLRWPFVIYAGFCAASGLLAFVLLPRQRAASGPPASVAIVDSPDGEPAASATPRRGLSWRTAVRLSADRAFLAALVMMAASRWAATGVRFSLVPVFGAEEVGASEAVVGFALTLAAVTHLALVWPAGKVADTLGRRALSVPAYLTFAVVAAMLGFVASVPGFLVMLALYGIGTGLTSVAPPAIVADVVPESDAGLGVGILNTAGDLGSVLGPLVSGFLAQVAGYRVGFGASALLLAFAALAALRMRETLPTARAVT